MTSVFSKYRKQSSTQWLFWTCYLALVATSFGFIIRAQILGDLQLHFNLSETQKGEILGVGLWPFALSIVLLSLIIDRIGYGRAMMFAFTCHIISVVITVLATGYSMLYWGTFILALGNGAVEAVVNPVVATLYSKSKAKWLNILHSGWPGGMVLGGLLILILMPDLGWRWKVGIILIPILAYGLMMLRVTFPVHERVKAGVPFKNMLQEAGIFGAIIVVPLMIWELGRVFDWSLAFMATLSFMIISVYGFYVRTLGKPLFLFLTLIMIPLATTELGTDSWITDLVTPVMNGIGLQAGWVLVYTSFLMTILRLSAGPIVDKIKPLGLLAISSVIAIVGLVFLSQSAGIMIFAAATIYGLGKSFFWPTMLGVVAERFPRGGALTLNTISGVGMLSVGIIGAAFLGNIQDRHISHELATQDQRVYEKVIGTEKTSILGNYYSVDQGRIDKLDAKGKETLTAVLTIAKKNALLTVAICPAIMLVCYLILIVYFRSKGGYRVVEIEPHEQPQ
jgi:MFS family permease